MTGRSGMDPADGRRVRADSDAAERAQAAIRRDSAAAPGAALAVAHAPGAALAVAHAPGAALAVAHAPGAALAVAHAPGAALALRPRSGTLQSRR